MGVRAALRQIIGATRFLSRLPLPDRPPDAPLAVTLRAAPWAGVVISLGPALLLAWAARLNLPALAAATLAVVTSILATGGLHEDGLADVADGFGGGRTVGRKLAIMRDSRVGSFGALALAAGLLLRVTALGGLVDRSGAMAAAAAMVGGAALSRGLMLVPLALLPPARPDGLAHAAVGSTLSGGALLAAGLVGGLLAWPAERDSLQVAAALVGALAAALGVTRLARHHLRGVTGDVVGATQQVTEIVFLLTLCAGAGPR